MAVALALRFPWGRYHGTLWGRHTNEAAVDWPPSPWRLLRALYSAGRLRVTPDDDASLQSLLGELGVPPTYDLPVARLSHSRHYLPADDYTLINNSKDLALDGFVSFDPTEDIVVRWSVDLPFEQLGLFREVAAALPYLGRAESPCVGRLVEPDHVPLADTTRQRWAPVSSADGGVRHVELLAPTQPVDFESLLARPGRIRGDRRILPPSSRRLIYATEDAVDEESTERTTVRRRRRERVAPTAVRWHIGGSVQPPVHAALAVGHFVRQAAMSKLDGFSPDLSGRTRPRSAQDASSAKREDQHRHAHYLAFSADRGPRLDTIVAWVPGGLSAEDLAALGRIRRVWAPEHVKDFSDLALGLEAMGPIERVVPELVGPARRWTTTAPFVPTRHRRRQDWLDFVAAEVRRELAYRNIAGASEAEVRRHGSDEDSWRFRRHRPNATLRDAHRAQGVELTLPEPVIGPLALGRFSHFGLGLFVPDGAD